MAVEGSCPQCGAEIQFNAGNSLVVVCDSCSSVVGRGDGALETYGKVSDLVQTDSPLQVGVEGEVKGSRFEITGRTQYRHSAGGVWDEWYVAFDGGERWGWLAEAQGRYYLTFPKELPDPESIPSVKSLDVEDEILIPGAGRMKVVEVGETELIAAEGELPVVVKPGDRHQYADLQGPGKRFATLDGSTTPPTLFYGGEFPLERLGLEFVEAREVTASSVESVGVTCPKCGGSIELHAPHESERFVCSYCDSMLSVEDGGSLKFIEALQKQKYKPLIPLGTEGELRGRKYTVIGFMRRKVRAEGKDYPWYEYLLYTPREPFHWLIHSENHWSLGKPVSAADVKAFSRTAYWEGKHFKGFDRSRPEVTNVYGEFYWKVSVGERVRSYDYVHPPFLLSREETEAEIKPDETGSYIPKEGDGKLTSREVNYTVSEYLPLEEVKQAFDVKGLREPRGVAPNQPFLMKGIYKYALMLFGAALIAGFLSMVMAPRKTVLEQTFKVPKDGAGGTQHSEPFELHGGRNLQVALSSPQANKWAYLNGGLWNEDRQELTKISVALSQNKAGAGKQSRKVMSGLPAGKYVLQTRFQTQSGYVGDRTIKVQIVEGVPTMGNWMVLLILLGIPPVLIGLYHVSFEARRWAESGLT